MAFVNRFDNVAEPTWQAIVDHPMVEKLGERMLCEPPFRYWVEQAYCCLRQYARVFAHGPTKASDIGLTGAFAELLDSTINTGMDRHRAYAADFDVVERDPGATKPSSHRERIPTFSSAWLRRKQSVALLPRYSHMYGNSTRLGGDLPTGNLSTGDFPTMDITRSGSRCIPVRSPSSS